MNKRDLKADLELFNRATPAPWKFGPIYDGTIAGELDEERHRANRELLNNFREGWPHAIERAIEAEALARELMEALKKAYEYIGDINSFYGQGLQVYGWHLNGAPEPLDNFIDSNGGCEAEEFVGRVLTKAKVVLEG
jgi:hypothetical protein